MLDPTLQPAPAAPAPDRDNPLGDPRPDSARAQAYAFWRAALQARGRPLDLALPGHRATLPLPEATVEILLRGLADAHNYAPLGRAARLALGHAWLARLGRPPVASPETTPPGCGRVLDLHRDPEARKAAQLRLFARAPLAEPSADTPAPEPQP